MSRRNFISRCRYGLAVLLAGWPALAWAQQSVDESLLPQNRETIILEETERNPFGQRTVKETVVEQVETEESRLRAFLQFLPVGGVSDENGAYKVLLGSLDVEAGQTLPALIAGQTEKIQVREVSLEKIELGFVEKDGSNQTRLIMVPINMKPEVRYLLEIQAGMQKGKAAESDLQGVIKDAPPQSN